MGGGTGGSSLDAEQTANDLIDRVGLLKPELNRIADLGITLHSASDWEGKTRRRFETLWGDEGDKVAGADAAGNLGDGVPAAALLTAAGHVLEQASDVAGGTTSNVVTTDEDLGGIA
jgi:hypothetical protein